MRRSIGFACVLLLAGCQEYDLHGKPDDNDDPDTDTEDTEDPTPQPDIEVEPEELLFGWLPVDCPSEPQTVTVRNVGEADLEVSAIELVGENTGAFELDADINLIAPGDEATFQVRFEPPDYITYDLADVQVSSNDPDEGEVPVGLDGTGSEEAWNEEQWEQPNPAAVDVLWVVDNSGSMSEEVARLNDSFEEFMNEFLGMGLDFHIGTTTTDLDNPEQAGRLQGDTKVIDNTTSDPLDAFLDQTDLGSGGSGSERGLDAAYAALTDPLLSNENAGLVREDSVLAVVIISDEEDQSVNIDPDDFVDWLADYKPDPDMTSLSVITGPESGIFPCSGDGFPPTTAEPAPIYADTAKQTGGDHFDICALDFDQVLAYLSYTAAGLATEFVLSDTPSSVGKIEVYVDGVEINYGYPRWVWDSDKNAVVFYPGSIPGPESEILIRYPVPNECE